MSKVSERLAQQEYDARVAELQQLAPHKHVEEPGPDGPLYNGEPLMVWDTFKRTYTPSKTVVTATGKQLVEGEPVQQVVIAIQTQGKLTEYTWPVGVVSMGHAAEAAAAAATTAAAEAAVTDDDDAADEVDEQKPAEAAPAPADRMARARAAKLAKKAAEGE